MNRTDRLYALVEELRAVSPRPLSAARLAARFEVSTRTVERDLLALQEAGVPIYAEAGRHGGYVLDAARTLPPVNFTPAEAAAIAIALEQPDATPLQASGRSALTKVLAAMAEEDARAARRIGGRVLLFAPPDQQLPRVPRVVEQAIVQRRVVRLRYRDGQGAETERVVEPVAVVGIHPNWYLTAWCRLRNDLRAFRLDRIAGAVLTREAAPDRALPDFDIPPLVGRPALAE